MDNFFCNGDLVMALDEAKTYKFVGYIFDGGACILEREGDVYIEENMDNLRPLVSTYPENLTSEFIDFLREYRVIRDIDSSEEYYSAVASEFEKLIGFAFRLGSRGPEIMAEAAEVRRSCCR